MYVISDIVICDIFLHKLNSTVVQPSIPSCTSHKSLCRPVYMYMEGMVILDLAIIVTLILLILVYTMITCVIVMYHKRTFMHYFLL